jgi:hypothetical protein
MLPLIAGNVRRWRSRYSDWLRAGRQRDQSSRPGRVKIFSESSRPALRPTQPPIQWVPWALSLGIKRPGREADHSPPISAEVKKTWVYISTPAYAFIALCLIKHRDNFTFLRWFEFLSFSSHQISSKSVIWFERWNGNTVGMLHLLTYINIFFPQKL